MLGASTVRCVEFSVHCLVQRLTLRKLASGRVPVEIPAGRCAQTVAQSPLFPGSPRHFLRNDVIGEFAGRDLCVSQNCWFQSLQI